MTRGLGLGLLLVVHAAAAQVESLGPLQVCRLPVTTATASTSRAVGRRAAPACDPAAEGARFDVTYTGFPTEAEAAFQAAVDTWACRIQSSQVIRIAATWAELDPSTLGSAGPFLYRNFPGAPSRGVWYPAALADDLAGRDLGGGDPDIDATFNASFGAWHFDTEAPPDGTYDLYTVVLHELGHGLGLIGAMTVEEGLGQVGAGPGGPYSYDLHTQDDQSVSLLTSVRYPDGSVALANALRAPVRFAGRAVAQSVRAPVPLYMPPRWADGGSYSHLDEDTFQAGTPDGLMTPFIAREEVVAAPGTAVCAMLADVGWRLAGDCLARVGRLPESGGALAVRMTGPNPFLDRTTVHVSSDDTFYLRAWLVDVLGRRVADYGSAVLLGGQELDIEVDGRGLAAGVYVLVASGAAETAAVPLTVVR